MFQSQRLLCNIGAILVVGLALGCWGCAGDDPTGPDQGAVPMFDEIWPVSVGQFWVYDLEDRVHDSGSQLYDRLEDIPPIPTMAELYADLAAGHPGSPLEVATGRLRWWVTTDATVDTDTTVMIVDSHMENLEGYPSPPLGLKMGSVWVHAGDRIATYSGGYLQWVHLDGALTPDHEFTVQLAEGLADDIILTNRVWRIRSYDVADEAVSNCVESFYLLDLGIQQAMDEWGDPSGYFRAYGYGMNIYAPGVGLVYCQAKLVGYDEIHLGTASLRERGELD